MIWAVVVVALACALAYLWSIRCERAETRRLTNHGRRITRQAARSVRLIERPYDHSKEDA